jgi:hypothetical protein
MEKSPMPIDPNELAARKKVYFSGFSFNPDYALGFVMRVQNAKESSI